MGRLRKKFAGNTAEASLEPVPSQQRTPKSLKPKPKISRNSLKKGTPQIQEKKKKKTSVLGSRKPSLNNEEDTDTSQSGIKRSTTGGEHDKKDQEDIKIKGKGAGLEKNSSEMNEENHSQLESQQDEKKKEKVVNLEKKQQFAKNKEKWFKKIEDAQVMEEKHGHLESQQNEKEKDKLDGLQKKQHFDKKKQKSLDKTEQGQMNEEKHCELLSQQDEKKKEKEKEKEKEKVGGLIFMCSAKTKPDCFRYSLMGLPMSKKEQVLGVKPGLKLFLYDFDLKLLYGIYSASSNGGMKLEPAAFGGAFPVQVRFTVYQDCYPLPESVFRRAIKENYNDKNRFNTELTDIQVEKLTKLFRSAEVHPHALLMVPTQMPAIRDTNVIQRTRESSLAHQHGFGASNLHSYDEGGRYKGQHLMYGEVPSAERQDFSQNEFPSEKEYRTYGLRGERQNFAPPTSQIAPPLEPHLGHVRQHIVMHPGYPAPVQVQRHDPHEATENLTYGAFPSQQLQSSTPLAVTALASTVDPYGSSGREESALLGSYSGSGRGESYLTDTAHLGRRENVDAAMLYSTHASNALSEYNQIGKHQGVGPESSLAPVSSRYSFAGPSLSRR